jgi:hypothetical protein
MEMYILIDRATLQVRYKHSNCNILIAMMYIEYANQAAVVLSCESETAGFTIFPDLDLKTLYSNMCGQTYLGHNRGNLILNVIALAELLPIDELEPLNVYNQQQAIDKEDLNFYRFDPHGRFPIKMAEQYYKTPLTARGEFTPVQGSITVPSAAPASYAPTAGAPRTPSQPRAPRPENTNPAEAPKSGSKTGRVWEIAEDIFSSHSGGLGDWKGLRNAIVAACESEGINPSTAGVQVGKWRHSKT